MPENHFQTIKTGPKNNFQNQIRKKINQCKTLIPQVSRWKCLNLNPSTRTIKSHIKIHKHNRIFRPIVNWRNAPAFELSKLFSQKINKLTTLTYTFYKKNTTTSLKRKSNTPYIQTAPLDIFNMYSNIPIIISRHVFNNIIKFNLIESNTNHELLTW
jgi:hypothetical protein